MSFTPWTPGESPQVRRDSTRSALERAAAVARARAIGFEAGKRLDVAREATARSAALVDAAAMVRDDLRDCVRRYAAALRETGVSPERALILVKAAAAPALDARSSGGLSGGVSGSKPGGAHPRGDGHLTHDAHVARDTSASALCDGLVRWFLDGYFAA